MSVMVLQGCKSSPQKSRPLESGHSRHGVWIAIEYSYKLGPKMNLNFSANCFAEIVTFRGGSRISERGGLITVVDL